MSQRRILVIGSQCEALQHLKFLPVAAQDLYAVMTNPERGACVSALDGEGLLIDPVVNDVKDAIRTAYYRAAKDGRHYSLPISVSMSGRDTTCCRQTRRSRPPPTPRSTSRTSSWRRMTLPPVSGLLAVLVDACYAGLAGFGAAQAWVSKLAGRPGSHLYSRWTCSAQTGLQAYGPRMLRRQSQALWVSPKGGPLAYSASVWGLRESRQWFENFEAFIALRSSQPGA